MKWIITIATVAIFIYFNNASWIRDMPEGELSLLAHRGVYQNYSKEGLTNETCTASRINTPEHEYIENTIESIKTAFSFGAKIVEIDIHPTIDGKFAVFHDWTIDCRTNGTGVTRGQTLEYLQTLDIGYGYTHDNGETYPFRGKGIGKIPSLTKVLDTFPEKQFLINIKSNRPKEADLISAFLSKRLNENLTRLWFYGGEEVTSHLQTLYPELKIFSRNSAKTCATYYELIAWTGYVPKACHDTILALPSHYAPYFWGWPVLLVNRLKDVNTEVILVDTDGTRLKGIDNPEAINKLSEYYHGIVWTDKIEQTGTLNLQGK